MGAVYYSISKVTLLDHTPVKSGLFSKYCETLMFSPCSADNKIIIIIVVILFANVKHRQNSKCRVTMVAGQQGSELH